MKLALSIPIFWLCCCALWAEPLSRIEFKNIDGEKVSLKAFEGKVVLIVNVASECGLTPQYEKLQTLYKKYSSKGFTVIGFPSNDFGEQEPGSHDEIKKFCSEKYNVTFPLAAKTGIKSGPEQNPLYVVLTAKESPFPGEVKWNFEKFLISRSGSVIARFDPEVEPDTKQVTEAIELALRVDKSH